MLLTLLDFLLVIIANNDKILVQESLIQTPSDSLGCRVILALGHADIAGFFDLDGIINLCKLFTPLGSQAATGAKLNSYMSVATAGGSVLGINSNCSNAPDSTGILLAGFRCDLAGVQANADPAHLAVIIQCLTFQTLMQRLHNLLEENRCRVHRSGADNLRSVIAGPNRCGIIAGEAAVPAVLKLGSRTGLTCNGLPLEICLGTGTVGSCVDQAVVHIVDRLFAEDLLLSLSIINNQIALAVIYLGKGTLLTADAVIGKGGIGACHITNMDTPGLRAHCKGCKTVIRVDSAALIHILIHQRSQAELILGKVVAVVNTDHIQRMGRHRIDGAGNRAVDGAGITILIVIVSGPCTVIIVKGQVRHNRCRRQRSLLEAGCIDGQGLDGRTGLQLGVGCAAPFQVTGLFADTASHCHNITGGVIDHHNGRLQLLAASGFGNFIQICIDLVYLLLHIQVNGGINMVTTALDLLNHQITGCAVPGHAVLFCQSLCHIHQNRIGKPAVVILRAVFNDRYLIAAIRAIEMALGFLQGTDNTLVIAGLILAVSHAVRQIDAVFQHQFLGKGFFIFFICQPAVLVHSPQNVFFSVVIILRVLIRIVPGGRIGNADDTCAFGSSQGFHFFTIVGFSGAANTTAALAQINKVQIQFQDFILIVLLF